MGSRIERFLADREKNGLMRRLTEVDILAGGYVDVKGRKYVNFSSNDYLGLAHHPDIIKAVSDLDVSVCGVSASRLMTGSTVYHHRLEDEIARLKNRESALILNSGYQANVGVISSLCGKGDVVFYDRLSHASIVDGVLLSGARSFRFRHNDTGHLEELLARERAGYDEALIITETVFSMDGDIAPVEDLIRLKKKYNCMFMADEAHATGVFGASGAGVLQEKDKVGDTDIVMGTFSKALGGFGAYIAVSAKMRDYLVNACRSLIYSTALPLPVINADLAALRVIQAHPDMGKELLDRACYFREGLKRAGFDVPGESQIIPVITGSASAAADFSAKLKELGYWVTPVRPPTVPEGSSRIRLSITLDHDKDILDRFINDISGLL